jgi:hypothetical protein
MRLYGVVSRRSPRADEWSVGLGTGTRRPVSTVDTATPSVDHASGRTTPDNEPTRRRLRHYPQESSGDTGAAAPPAASYRPRMTVSTSRRIEESPRHRTTAVPLPRAPHRPPPELRSASILAASKFTLGARGVRIAGQHAIGRVQPAAGQGRAVFTGHLPRPRPSTPVLSTGPWVLRSNLYPEDGRQSIGLSCR